MAPRRTAEEEVLDTTPSPRSGRVRRRSGSGPGSWSCCTSPGGRQRAQPMTLRRARRRCPTRRSTPRTRGTPGRPRRSPDRPASRVGGRTAWRRRAPEPPRRRRRPRTPRRTAPRPLLRTGPPGSASTPERKQHPPERAHVRKQVPPFGPHAANPNPEYRRALADRSYHRRGTRRSGPGALTAAAAGLRRCSACAPTRWTASVG